MSKKAKPETTRDSQSPKKKNSPPAKRPKRTGEEELLQKAQERLGYSFKKTELLLTALTHSSYANELRARGINASHNERLEFLGDSVLSVITADYLYHKLGHQPEGELTRLRAMAVCENALFDYARAVELGGLLFLGHGEEASNGRERKSILADAFEAVIAAIYLDSGMNAARDFTVPFVERNIRNATDEKLNTDYKTLLQQVIQQNKGEQLEYSLNCEKGPDHDKIFVMDATLNDNVIGTGEGHSKREAEQMAAKKALELFGIKQ
ncbi:MAG: ribonuclease III [Eubacteriales bacterium]